MSKPHPQHEELSGAIESMMDLDTFKLGSALCHFLGALGEISMRSTTGDLPAADIADALIAARVFANRVRPVL